MEFIAIVYNRVYHFFTWTNEKELACSEQISPVVEQTMENRESEKDNNIKRIEKLEKVICQVNERMEEVEGMKNRMEDVERMKNRMEEMDENLREKQQKIARLEEKLQKCQELLKEAFTKLATAIVQWIELRREIIKKLETVADVMEKKKNDTNIGVLSGSLAGLTGAGLTIAGLVLTPVTCKSKR